MLPLAPVVVAARHVRLEPLAAAYVPGLVAAAAAAGTRDSFVWT